MLALATVAAGVVGSLALVALRPGRLDGVAAFAAVVTVAATAQRPLIAPRRRRRFAVGTALALVAVPLLVNHDASAVAAAMTAVLAVLAATEASAEPSIDDRWVEWVVGMAGGIVTAVLLAVVRTDEGFVVLVTLVGYAVAATRRAPLGLGSPPIPDMATSTPPFEPPEGRVACYWIYVPLPQPLGLPDGWMAVQERTPEEFVRSGARSPYRYSLVVRHTDRTANVFDSDSLDLEEVAMRSGRPENQGPPWASIPELRDLVASTNDSDLTVIEVAVPLEDGPTIASVDAALDIALEAAQQTQRNVGVLLQRAVRLVTRSTLPPFLPAWLGTIKPDGGGEPTFDHLLHVRVEGGPPSLFGLRPEPLTDEQLRNLFLAGAQLTRGSLLATYADLRREAQVQRHLDGNSRLSVLTIASAGEVFLDSILLHMMWEEHVAPADAATVFDRSIRHQSRVANQFPPRLAGNWDPNGSAAVGSYFAHIAWLRNRVVHTGAEPSADQVAAAFDALYGLEHFVGDRLCTPGIIGKYTRTAMAFMGERGIRRRSAWTRQVQDLVADPLEPNWIDTFKRYRHLVDRHLEGSIVPGAKPDALELYFEVTVDGSTRFVLHDTDTLSAAVVSDATPYALPAQLAQLDHVHAAAASAGEWLRVHVQTVITAPAEQESWQAEQDLFPDLRIFPGPSPA